MLGIICGLTSSAQGLFRTAAGFVLWEDAVEATLRTSDLSSVEDDQPQNVYGSPTELRQQLSWIVACRDRRIVL